MYDLNLFKNFCKRSGIEICYNFATAEGGKTSIKFRHNGKDIIFLCSDMQEHGELASGSYLACKGNVPLADMLVQTLDAWKCFDITSACLDETLDGHGKIVPLSTRDFEKRSPVTPMEF
jgi:hypothetical protein